MRCVAGLALVGEVVPRIVRAARECHTPHGRMPLGPIFNPYRVVAVRAVAPKLVKAVVGEGQVIVVIPAGDAKGAFHQNKLVLRRVIKNCVS